MDHAFKLTTNGRALIAACVDLEKPLQVSRVAVGSGMVPDGTDLADVHALFDYVADGSIGDRYHENDHLYITIQYANSEHKEQPTFFLSEFIVYAKHPETGMETDLLYATMGDYRQPVPAYRAERPGSVFTFPLVIVVSDEIDVICSAPAGLVTQSDLERSVAQAVAANATACINIVITAANWQSIDGEWPWRLDLPCKKAAVQHIPDVTIHRNHLGTAARCGLCPEAETVDGGLRFYAMAQPEADMEATVQLANAGSGTAGVDGTYTLPVASPDTLGGIRSSDSLRVDPDGVAHAVGEIGEEWFFTDDEFGQLLDNAFGTDK